MAEQVQRWLTDNGFGQVTRKERVAGGSINISSRLYLSDGRRVFLKQHDSAPAQMFIAEAAGLSALRQAKSLRVPEVLHVAESFLLLEDLGSGQPDKHYWQELGSGLADLHGNQQPQFGFSTDNYCGSTPQINPPTDDGFEFFANFRIRKLAVIARERKLLNSAAFNALEYIAENLSRWIPTQPAVLIHGDLWSGNIHCDEHGGPALIDPAAYWGWAEAELAMTRLFGGFGESFYASYAEHSGMASDWPQRAELYNLYHLLNHLLLFGGSYGAQIEAISRRFAP